jgi:hypothetical protein
VWWRVREEGGLVGKDLLPPTPVLAYDKNNPPMCVGSIYPNMHEFRLALSQNAIKHEFEFNIKKSDSRTVRVYCSGEKDEGCWWRLHARTMKDNITMKVTFVQLDSFCCVFILQNSGYIVKGWVLYLVASLEHLFNLFKYMPVTRNPHKHSYSTQRRNKVVKNARKFWVCEQVKDWLVRNGCLRVWPSLSDSR